MVKKNEIKAQIKSTLDCETNVNFIYYGNAVNEATKKSIPLTQKIKTRKVIKFGDISEPYDKLIASIDDKKVTRVSSIIYFFYTTNAVSMILDIQRQWLEE